VTLEDTTAPPVRAHATVREATFGVLRRLELTTIFSNPGSTEVPFLAGLPDDLTFVLALHEGAVVAMAAGHALGAGRPALALLHSTPGLGNAVAALATARANRAPLVVVVGQQDRRHLALDPFLAGKLEGLAGEYPVWVNTPTRAQDVPGTIVRAYHEAATHKGPAVVIVPMDDWLEPAGETTFGAQKVVRSQGADPRAVGELATLLEQAEAPVIVSGAGADWEALTSLAETLGCPVWQEPFGGFAGFPQDHPQFAGHLPSRRARLRTTLDRHDVVLVVGTGALRQYPYDSGPLFADGTRVAVVTEDPDEAHRSPAELAVLGDPGSICDALSRVLEPRELTASPMERPGPPDADERLRPAHVLHALAERLPRDAILVEETPSSRPELHARIAATAPLGFVSAMGLLGFGLPAAIGLKLARPERPVVAVLGDGASLYQILGLWSAARYEVGVLFVVLVNRGYAIMDRLAERSGAPGPWPEVDVDLVAMARAQGCEAVRVTDQAELLEQLDRGLDRRDAPLLLAVEVAQDPTFDP
jgi:benzoylformate decarboxylase